MTTRLRSADLLAPRKCQLGGSDFTPRTRGKGMFCSRVCANTAASRGSAAKRGDMQRGRGDGKTYRKLHGRHEHRVVAEQMLGRALRPGEVVHHIDGNHLNNSPNNLAVMTQAEHMLAHGLARPGVTPAWKPWEHRRSA